MGFAGMMVVALGLDLCFGWPPALYRRIRHPVVWIGKGIDWLDKRLNQGRFRRGKGMIAMLVITGGTVLIACLVQGLLDFGWLGVMLGGVLAWPMLAARSMQDHVEAIITPLSDHDLATARRALSMIVGRETADLDASAISRAALESLAENTADGIVAPLFWGVIAGLPGIMGYKAINTLDSMIGHRTPRHEAFGWASARLDDLVNLIPARLTALLFAAISGRARVGWVVAWRDAGQHRSPNAGWPEGAMAGALGVRLSGPRVYAGQIAPEPWVNETGRDCTPDDLARGLGLFRRSMTACLVITLLLALI